MKVKINLLSIEIQTEQKKNGSAKPKQTLSQTLKNIITIAQVK